MGNEKIEQMLESVFTDECCQAAAGKPFTDMDCWDSLRYVHLVLAVQSTFSIELNSSQIQRITSLHGLHEVLKEHNIINLQDPT